MDRRALRAHGVKRSPGHRRNSRPRREDGEQSASGSVERAASKASSSASRNASVRRGDSRSRSSDISDRHRCVPISNAWSSIWTGCPISPERNCDATVIPRSGERIVGQPTGTSARWSEVDVITHTPFAPTGSFGSTTVRDRDRPRRARQRGDAGQASTARNASRRDGTSRYQTHRPRFSRSTRPASTRIFM